MTRILLSIASFCLAVQAPLLAAVSDRSAARLLDQAAWGPTPTDIAAVQAAGLSTWIDQQMAANVSDLPDQPLLDVNMNTNTNVGPIRSVFFQNAVSNSDQLRQRVAFMLTQLWVVSQQEGTQPAYAYPPYWRVMRDNAFSNYATLIKAVTLNPAMGRYLNMANNNKAAAGTSPNENYPREVMQLFTLGTNQLNPDGSLTIGPNGPIPTYTELDVENLARVLTGWTYPTNPANAAKNNNPEYYFGPMFAPATDPNHDKGAKVLFGVSIPMGQTAEQDLDLAIKILMQQKTMAPFICRQYIEHLVTSNPSPGYISRMSAVFTNNGSGVTGDMQAVIKAILLDPEARLADDPTQGFAANAGHLREPLLMFANVLRGLNATVTSSNAIGNYTSNLAQNLFDSPSVFSYFSPASRTEKGLYGPEFQIYSTQTSALRSDYIYTMIYGSLDGTTKVNLSPFNAKTAPDYVALVDYINYVFFYHSASADLVSNAILAAKGAASPAHAVQSALFVMLTSAEYQVIR